MKLLIKLTPQEMVIIYISNGAYLTKAGTDFIMHKFNYTAKEGLMARQIKRRDIWRAHELDRHSNPTRPRDERRQALTEARTRFPDQEIEWRNHKLVFSSTGQRVPGSPKL